MEPGGVSVLLGQGSSRALGAAEDELPRTAALRQGSRCCSLPVSVPTPLHTRRAQIQQLKRN